MKIGIVYICTGKYRAYLDGFVASFSKHFFPEVSKCYFILTDDPVEEVIGKYSNPLNDFVYIPQKKVGWPYDTLYRFKWMSNLPFPKEITHLFYFNANMVCVQDISFQLIDGLIACEHPGFYRKPRSQYSYEPNPVSTAYIPPHQGSRYYQACFFGGSTSAFLELCRVSDVNITTDEQKNFIAVWHDESHLNRYLVNHPPQLVLDPSYIYPEKTKELSEYQYLHHFQPKIIQLLKNHQEMRS